MRIALLAGSLEPGRDGVGDYTHGLAMETVTAGVKVMTVALADSYAAEEMRGTRNGVSELRLPTGMDWATRLRSLRVALDEFDPDWISLQFVPYSFHRRGWVHRLAARLKPLLGRSMPQSAGTRKRSFHLMFHELWLGTYSQIPWKHRLEGFWQRHGILAFIRSMGPNVVHTSNPRYARVLQECGVATSVLPLFGSIPFEDSSLAQKEAETWLAAELQALGIRPEERDSWWVFGVFGSIYSGWWPGHLFTTLLTQSPPHRRRLALLVVGNSHAGSDKIITRLAREFGDRVPIGRMGEQTAPRVGAIFSHLNFGLSTSAWPLIGKSSSALAMREHGLPVIVTRTEGCTAEERKEASMGDPLLLPYDSFLPSKLEQIKRDQPRCRRPAIAKRWLESLDSDTYCQ